MYFVHVTCWKIKLLQLPLLHLADVEANPLKVERAIGSCCEEVRKGQRLVLVGEIGELDRDVCDSFELFKPSGKNRE